MKPRHTFTTSFTASLLCLVIAAAASTGIVAQQDSRAAAAAQREGASPQAGVVVPPEDECANAPNNVGQGAVENVQGRDAEANAQTEGLEQGNQLTPGSNAQIAQNEDNCFDAHEDPGTNENVSRDGVPATGRQDENPAAESPTRDTRPVGEERD